MFVTLSAVGAYFFAPFQFNAVSLVLMVVVRVVAVVGGGCSSRFRPSAPTSSTRCVTERVTFRRRLIIV